VGLFHEVRWSKTSGTDSCPSPICLQHIEHDSNYKRDRYTSTPSITTRRSSIPRNNNNSVGRLSLHVQSMKKSAFKMLCKYEDY
jgi:hypothetical protein